MKPLLIAFSLILASCYLLWLALPAAAHDHWINEGRYRSPIDGMLCCGKEDCVSIDAKLVTISPRGYEIAEYKDVIPFTEALPSEDGKYHRCHNPVGSLRCFFAPGQGS